eukprot:g11686.t1
MARKNGPGLGPRLAPLAFLACALKLSFVGIHQSRNTLVPRRGEGFEGAPSPKARHSEAEASKGSKRFSRVQGKIYNFSGAAGTRSWGQLGDGGPDPER